MFQNSEASTTVLCFLVNDRFGDDVWNWDPTTIYLEIRDEWGCDPAPNVMDKISAGQVLITTPAFFQDIGAFSVICNTLASGTPAFTVYDPVEVEEMAWAMVEVALIRDMLAFAPMIKDLIRFQLTQDGYDDTSYPSVFTSVLGGTDKTPDELRQLMIEPSIRNDETTRVMDFVNDMVRTLLHQFEAIGRPDLLQKMMDGLNLDEMLR